MFYNLFAKTLVGQQTSDIINIPPILFIRFGTHNAIVLNDGIMNVIRTWLRYLSYSIVGCVIVLRRVFMLMTSVLCSVALVSVYTRWLRNLHVNCQMRTCDFVCWTIDIICPNRVYTLSSKTSVSHITSIHIDMYLCRRRRYADTLKCT